MRAHRAFQTFGAFTSGIGVHYEPSALVDTSYQELAPKLTIGERLIPQVVVRAADARPFELQDLLPADTRFKLLVFAGATAAPAQLARVRVLAGRPAPHEEVRMEQRREAETPSLEEQMHQKSMADMSDDMKR